VTVHPLKIFLYETFGQKFGDLISAGYGDEPNCMHQKLHIIESKAGEEIHWTIEIVGDYLPCGNEPLVLAALLKLLLSRPSISHCLEFELNELLSELQWRDDVGTRHQVQTTIINYARLLYDKQVNTQARQRKSALTEEGCYHLLTGYVRGTESDISGVMGRAISSIYFDATFIEGLRRGRVYFAGVDFGPLNGPFGGG
jgi:hypothetical protein